MPSSWLAAKRPVGTSKIATRSVLPIFPFFFQNLLPIKKNYCNLCVRGFIVSFALIIKSDLAYLKCNEYELLHLFISVATGKGE